METENAVITSIRSQQTKIFLERCQAEKIVLPTYSRKKDGQRLIVTTTKQKSENFF